MYVEIEMWTLKEGAAMPVTMRATSSHNKQNDVSEYIAGELGDGTVKLW
jgi:hypothetical protein